MKSTKIICYFDYSTGEPKFKAAFRKVKMDGKTAIILITDTTQPEVKRAINRIKKSRGIE